MERFIRDAIFRIFFAHFLLLDLEQLNKASFVKYYKYTHAQVSVCAPKCVHVCVCVRALTINNKFAIAFGETEILLKIIKQNNKTALRIGSDGTGKWEGG